LREKYGGIKSQVPLADAKKLGLIKTIETVPKEKPPKG